MPNQHLPSPRTTAHDSAAPPRSLPDVLARLHLNLRNVAVLVLLILAVPRVQGQEGTSWAI